MIRPTMFDAFVNTMKKQHIAHKTAKKIVEETQKYYSSSEKIAKDILEKSGVNADISCRVKSVESTKSKIIRYMDDFDTYQNNREIIHDIFLGKGMSELIGDAMGIRYTLKTPESVNIFHTISDKALKHKNFFVTRFENYHGFGVTPYANSNVLENFAKLKYKNSLGVQKNTIATNAEKINGYTRDNINSVINGVNAEIQIGGKYTIKWGNVEHLLYDIRQGKTPDLSKYTPEQKKLAKNIIYEYKKLMNNKKANNNFTENYLRKIWQYLRKSEIQNLDQPIYPPFLEGYPDILKAENLMKLAHV